MSELKLNEAGAEEFLRDVNQYLAYRRALNELAEKRLDAILRFDISLLSTHGFTTSLPAIFKNLAEDRKLNDLLVDTLHNWLVAEIDAMNNAIAQKYGIRIHEAE